MDCSPPGFSFRGISQIRILEWVAISFSRAYSWPRNWTQASCIAGRFFTEGRWVHFLVCDLMAIRLQPFPMVRPSLGPTIANGCSPVGARSQAFFSFLSALKAQELTLECYKHLMTVKSLFIECGRKYKFLTCLKKRKKTAIFHILLCLCALWHTALVNNLYSMNLKEEL